MCTTSVCRHTRMPRCTVMMSLNRKKNVPHSSALILCKFLFPCLCQKTNNFIQLTCNRLLIILCLEPLNNSHNGHWRDTAESLVHTVPQVTVPLFDRFCAVKDVDQCYLLIRWNDSTASLQRVKSLLWHLVCQDNNVVSFLLLLYLKGQSCFGFSPLCYSYLSVRWKCLFQEHWFRYSAAPVEFIENRHLYAHVLLFILWFCSVTEVVKREHQVWDLERKAEERWKPDTICPSLTRHYFTKQITKKCKLSININTTHSFTSIYRFLNPVVRNFLPFNDWRACGWKNRTKTSTLHFITLWMEWIQNCVKVDLITFCIVPFKELYKNRGNSLPLKQLKLILDFLSLKSSVVCQGTLERS